MGRSFAGDFALAEMTQRRLRIEQGRTNEMQMTRHPLQPMAFLARLVHGIELRSQIVDGQRGRRQRGIEALRGRVIEEVRYLMQRMRD
jgi:hypothetical protein